MKNRLENEFSHEILMLKDEQNEARKEMETRLSAIEDMIEQVAKEYIDNIRKKNKEFDEIVKNKDDYIENMANRICRLGTFLFRKSWFEKKIPQDSAFQVHISEADLS